MRKDEVFTKQLDRTTFDNFTWSSLVDHANEKMPFTSTVLKSALPPKEVVCKRHLFGRFVRRQMSTEEAQDRLNRKEALMHSIILYSNFPRSHTLIPQLFSVSLSLSRGTQDVRTLLFFLCWYQKNVITFSQLLTSCNMAGLSLNIAGTRKAVNRLLAMNEEADLEDWVQDVNVLFLFIIEITIIAPQNNAVSSFLIVAMAVHGTPS
jgi:hypothetical protein